MAFDRSEHDARIDRQDRDVGRLATSLLVVVLQKKRDRLQHSHDALSLTAVKVVDDEQDAEVSVVNTRHEVHDASDVANLHENYVYMYIVHA